jgi:hypothetical protein
MSGNDNLLMNNLERALSADINDLQSIQARAMAEMARYGWATKRVADPLAESPGPFVLGGLLVSPSLNNVAVSQGVMGQISATLSPVPGTLDSTYRLSRLSSVATVVMPSPGTTTWYLLEAQMVQSVVTSAVRDIYNPGTQTFSPSLVPKVIEQGIQFQVVAGAAGQAPAPSGGNWVPIAIVRRPGGGGPVAATDITDVRPLLAPRFSAMVNPLRRLCRTSASVSNDVEFAFELDGPGGRRAAVGTADLTSVSYLDPGAPALAANAIRYVYLAPWSGLAPRQNGSVAFEGVLVVSNVAPTAGARNSAALTLPAPYGVASVATFAAYYAATLVRNSANTGWVPMTTNGNRTDFGHGTSYVAPFSDTFAPPATGDNALTTALVAPPTARTLLYQVCWNGAAAAGLAVNVRFQPTASTTDLAGAAPAFNDASASTASFSVQAQNTSLDLNIPTAGLNAGTSCRVRLEGWIE